jgi:hypothetical protein
MSLVTGFFFLVLILNQRWPPPHRLQVSHCSTFRIMCDVPNIAVFCSESVECYPGTASLRFSLYSTASNYKRYNRIFQVPHSLYLPPYLNSCILKFFSASFCIFLSARIATSVSVRVFSLFLIITGILLLLLLLPYPFGNCWSTSAKLKFQRLSLV